MTTRRSAAPATSRQPAAVDPVARLMVDVPLPHLDRPFDYLVPTTLDATVTAGSRVRVRFAGRLVDAYVLERRAVSEHDGRLAFLDRAVGDEPVLTPETAALFRAVADRWAGSFVDVVRLGVPARHAAAEAAVAEAVRRPSAPDGAGFERYHAGPAFLAATGSARAARAVWTALPGESWPERL
ncbi:MAG: primosomal protein, partial [Pseudonocardiales bacterium]|nr:primosomal protein [Pseudonocardiales bacterium]